MWLGYVPSTFSLVDLASTSDKLRAHRRTCLNVPCIRVTLRQFSMQPGELPLTFVKFPCDWETFHPRSVFLGDLLSNAVKFFVRSENFPSIFCGAGRPSINFCQLLGGWVTIRQLPATLCGARRTCVNFSQYSGWPGNLPATSGNFGTGQENFRNSLENVPCSGGQYCYLMVSWWHLWWAGSGLAALLVGQK